MKEFINFLKGFGLTEKQAKIYLACLELGESSVAEIAQKSNLKRTTIYNLTNEMLERGFLSKYGEKRKEKYIAEPPDKLLSILENKKTELSDWLPKLLAITNSGSTFKPEVRFYQGKEGLKAVYEDTLKTCQKGDEILNCLAVEGSYDVLPKYIFNYMKRRVEKGIKMRAIAKDSSSVRKRKANDKKELRHIKIVPEHELPVSIEKNIYKDKVALMNFRGYFFGIIIKSPQIAKSEKAIFELLWKKLT